MARDEPATMIFTAQHGMREALQEAIDVFEGMNDDEINVELLPRLREALRQAAAPQGREASSSIDHQQRRGAAWDIIDEAISSYDEWMLDDDYDFCNILSKIIVRMRARRELYALTPAVAPEHKELDKHEQREADIKSMVADRDRARSVDFSDAETMRPVPTTPAVAPDGAGEAWEKKPYPSVEAMKSAVELEIHAALGGVQTVVIGQMIQKAIDAALAQAQEPGEDGLAERPFYGAECPSYPACDGGCGLGCTKEIERRKALALTPAVAPGGAGEARELLLKIHSALDDALGDTDVTHIESDDELRERCPVQWAAQELSKFISSDAAAPNGTSK